VRNVSEWAQVRTLVADGVSQREIAARLGMNRRTVRRLAGAAEPPRYRRQPSGSMLDPLDSVLRKLVADFEGIRAPRVTELLRDDYGYGGSVDLVRRRLAELRPKAGRPAQKTGYREIARPFEWTFTRRDLERVLDRVEAQERPTLGLVA